MLADVVAHLRCPHCALELREDGGTLRCESGHAFDVARQGYVSLLDGRAARGDTAAMVDARERFLRAGHLDPLTAALVETAGEWSGCAVDIGAGTGWHLARVLGGSGDTPVAAAADALAGEREAGAPSARAGLALDSSKYALRRAARAHPRIGAVACDAWRPLPIRDAAAALVLSVFAPRDAAEIARILAPDGRLIAVTPTPSHLRELVDALGLLTVDEGKPERLDEKLAPVLALASRRTLAWELSLGRDHALAAAAMGPTAHHTPADALADAAARLPTPLHVTAEVTISAYREAAPTRS